MDEGKFLAVLQHIVGALHQVAVSAPSGNPHVVQMVNAAQAILTELNPPPKPASPEDDAAEAEDDEDEDDTPKRGPGRPRTVTRHK